MTKRQSDEPWEGIPRDRPDHDPAESEGVVISRVLGGPAVIVPKALRDLEGEALEPVAELQHAAAEMTRIRERIDVLVDECRDYGVSWNSIGWLLGITAQSAQSRFRGAEKP